MTSPTLDNTPAPPESTLRTLAGLAIVWFCLMLVFQAHMMSDSYVLIGSGHGERSVGLDGSGSSVADHEQLLLPITLVLFETSPRDALKYLAGHLGIAIEPESRLNALADRPQGIRISDRTFDDTVHALLNDPQVGYALNAGELLLFEQTLEVTGAGASRRLQWQATLPVGEEPLLVSPAADPSLSFSVELHSGATEDESPPVVVMEVWDSGRLLTMTQVPLDETGQGEVRLETPQRVLTIQLARQQPDEASDAEQFRFTVDYAPASEGAASPLRQGLLNDDLPTSPPSPAVVQEEALIEG